MKIQDIFRCARVALFSLMVFIACVVSSLPARAGLTMTLEMSHERAPTYFTTNYQTLLYDFEPNANLPAAPSGTYTVSSPTGALAEGFDLSSAGVSNFTGYADSTYSDFNSFINELTNGNWTITVSNGTTTVYSFKISAPGFTSNTLPAINVTYPLDGSTIASNNPTFTWQGISWSSGDVQAEDSSIGFFQEGFLSTTATSWTSPSNLPAGQNTFNVTYVSSILSTITASTPTNGLGQTIGSWTFSPFIADYTIDVFTVSNAPPPPPTLAQALNTTNLTWTTSGHSNWVGETSISHDGVSAAQSASVTGLQTSILQTTVTGPGTLTFWWQTGAADFDFDLEFDLDGSYYDDIDGHQSWIQEPTVSIPSGSHTLSWTASAGGSVVATNAGWVDQVQFTGPGGSGGSNAPVDVSVSVTIQRNNVQAGGTSSYSAYAEISEVSPAPVTTDELVSPDGFMTSTVNAGDDFQDNSTQEGFTSLDDAIFACTNGQWSLYINQGAANQQLFHFKMAINGLTSNQVGLATILTPAPNAVNVATNPPLSWSGPTNASYLFVEAYQVSPSFVFDGYTNLATNLTSWPSPPALQTGTNIFFVEYGYFNLTNATFTMPVDTNLNPVATFGSSFYVYTDAQTQFSVRNPLAVQMSNSPPAANGGNFGLSFQTIAGHTNIVQMRTNLFLGSWTNVTNFVGDGNGYNLSIPITNSPGKYFRVITQ